MSVPEYLWSLAAISVFIAACAWVVIDVKRICQEVRLYDLAQTGLAQEQPLSPRTTAGDAPHLAVTGEASTTPYDWATEDDAA